MLHGQFHPHLGIAVDAQRAAASDNILGRWLHFGMALCIVLCLGLSSFAAGWAAGRAELGTTIAFNLHKFIGLNALLLLSLFLLWSACGHTRQWADLFPWFSRSRLRLIAGELANPALWLRMHATPAMLQGSGIAAGLAATTTGLALVLADLWRPPGPAELLRALTSIHRGASTALWAYLSLHLFAVMLHAALGKGARLRQMFRLLHLDGKTPAPHASPELPPSTSADMRA